MNIEEFEEKLNQFPADTSKVFNQLLSISIKNQAMLEILMSFHTDDEYGFVKPKDRMNNLHSIAQEIMNQRIYQIQADVTSKIYSED